MLGAQFLSNLTRRVDGRIYFSSKPFLGCRQRFHYVLERRVSDYKQVDVAGGAELAAGRRAEDQGHQRALAELRECLTEHVGESCRLGEQSPQLRKDRGLAVGLEIHLPPLNGASNEVGSSQLIEPSLHGADHA